MLKSDSERLQTSMPEAGFEPADYSTKWQRPTIRPSPGLAILVLELDRKLPFWSTYVIPTIFKVVFRNPLDFGRLPGYRPYHTAAHCLAHETFLSRHGIVQINHPPDWIFLFPKLKMSQYFRVLSQKGCPKCRGSWMMTLKIVFNLCTAGHKSVLRQAEATTKNIRGGNSHTL